MLQKPNSPDRAGISAAPTEENPSRNSAAA